MRNAAGLVVMAMAFGVAACGRSTLSSCAPCCPAPGPAHGGTTVPNGKAYDAMFFRDHGVNPFVDADQDALSTFAVDVDDASYAIARRYLHEGNRPEADAVRVEEFVNHFDYGYPAPAEEAFALHAAAAPSRFGKDLVLLRFALQGRDAELQPPRARALTFVVDTSGSMAGENRLGLVKRSLRVLVDRLGPEDTVGIVGFGSEAYVALPPTSIHQRQRVLDAVERLAAGGSTYAEQGLRTGYAMAEQQYRPNAWNRVVLCSDGVANVGLTDADGILAVIDRQKAKGIYLSTVGFGMGNYNDVLMERLGDRGNGHYAYVDTADAAGDLFGTHLDRTLQVVARDAKVQVEFDPKIVRSYRLLGYENRDVADRDFRNDLVDGGEVGPGHAVTALYEVRLWPGTSGRIADLRCRWADPMHGTVHEKAMTIATSDVAPSFETAEPSLQLAAAAAEFAELLRGSYWSREGSLAQVSEALGMLPRTLASSADVIELRDLVERARRTETRARPPS